MKISNNGINLIKEFEGCRLVAYPDQVGVYTIGYGSTRGVYNGQTITQQEAEDLLLTDLTRFEDAVNRLVTTTINQNQFDALVSFSFNLGIAALTGSTLLKLINTDDFKQAAANFPLWDHAGGVFNRGLLRRRIAESNLFNL